MSFGVAQISAMGRTELDKVQERIEPKLEQMMGEKQIQMIFVMLTDILNESTYLIYRGAEHRSWLRQLIIASLPIRGLCWKMWYPERNS